MLMALKRATLATAIAFGALGASSVLAEDKLIKIDGSSTVYPITEAVAEEFQKTSPGTKVTVGISGTGGGFKKFVRGEIDISNASRPIKASEMEEAKKNGIDYIELPVAFDALTVMVNPANTFVQNLSVADLKKIWEPDAQGKVVNWNQVNAAYPNVALKLYGPGTDSGTFDYFTEAVNGKSKASRGDYTASEDDNVLVQGVSGDTGALGYFGYAYYVENKDKLKAVPIVNAQGQAVLPSVEAVKDGSYNPLSRPIFIYVNKKSLEKPEVQEFVNFFLQNATDIVEDVKYIPLTAEAYTMATQRVAEGKTGTVFGGKEKIGITIEELFKMELKH